MVKEAKPWDSPSKRSKYSFHVVNQLITYKIIIPFTFMAIYLLVYLFSKYILNVEVKQNNFIVYISLIITVIFLISIYIRNKAKRRKRI